MQNVQIEAGVMVASGGFIEPIVTIALPVFSANIVMIDIIASASSVLSVGNASLHAIPAPTLIKEKEELALCV